MPPGTRRRDRGGGLGYGVGDSRRWRVEFRRVGGALLQFDPDLLGAPGLVVVSGETLALIRGCGGFTGAPFTGCFTGPQPTKSKCRAEFSGLRAYFFPGTGSLGMMSRRKHYLTAAVIALPLGAVLLFGQAAQNPGISVRELRCEYMSNPQGIDVAKPRLSWMLAPGGERWRTVGVPRACRDQPVPPAKGPRRSVGLGPGGVRAAHLGGVRWKSTGLRAAGLVESAGLERGRKGPILERTGILDDGAAAGFRLEGQVHR